MVRRRCCCSSEQGFRVGGCIAPLASTVIQFWDHSGGTQLFTRTTDAGGNLTAPPGTYWIKPDNVRFGGVTKTVYSGMSNFSFPANTPDYFCINCCNLPIKNRVIATSTNLGMYTGNWATGACPDTEHFPGSPSGYAMYASISQSLGFDGIWRCFPDFVAFPYPGCIPSCIGAVYTSGSSLSCPPSFSLSGSYTLPVPGGACGLPDGWTDTLTLTEAP